MSLISHSGLRIWTRRKVFFCLSLFLCSSIIRADNWKALKEGDQVAQEFLKNIEKKKAEAGSHLFSQGLSKEAKLNDTQLTQQSQTLFWKDPASQMIRESSDSRPQIKIDSTHDPLIVRAQKVMADPLEEIGGKGTHATEIMQRGNDEIMQCEEVGEDALESCTHQLVVKVVKTKIRKEWTGQLHYWMPQRAIKHGVYLACGSLRTAVRRARLNNGEITAAYKACMQELASKSRRASGCITLALIGINTDQIKDVKVEKLPPRVKKNGRLIQRFHKNCSGLTYNDLANKRSWYDCKALIKIVYEEDSYKILPDEWVSNCDRLEGRVDQGLCHYSSKICTQGHQTRLIEGIPITRDCWQEKRTYACSYPAKDDCGPLRARGCVQINSTCKQYVGNICVVHSQTYQCQGQSRRSYQIQGGKAPFCLDGNCRDQSWESNNEMMSALAQLTLLKEMQGTFKNGFLFRGEDNRCSKQPLSFKDCCGSGKGWGTDIGLASCSSQEKALSKKRKTGLCHYVGTYCAKKLPIVGTCIKKKATYCCFSSKLLKAFHEQGRPQIRLGWGSGKEPLCRGFTVNEIQRIDFSKLDLREVFEDLMKNYKLGKTQNLGQKVNERLEVIKQSLIPKATKQTKQRNEG